MSENHCPTCDSPDPHLHPAMQFEGEVQPCRDPWHGPEFSEAETVGHGLGLGDLAEPSDIGPMEAEALTISSYADERLARIEAAVKAEMARRDAREVALAKALREVTRNYWIMVAVATALGCALGWRLA